MKVKDIAGNEAVYKKMANFIVDFGPPESTIIAAPPKQTTSRVAEFTMGYCIFSLARNVAEYVYSWLISSFVLSLGQANLIAYSTIALMSIHGKPQRQLR